MPAYDMPFARNALADGIIQYTFAQSGNLTYIFVANCHGGNDVFFAPRIPVVDVYIGSADCCFVYFNKNFASLGNGDGNAAER